MIATDNCVKYNLSANKKHLINLFLYTFLSNSKQTWYRAQFPANHSNSGSTELIPEIMQSIS